MLIIYLITISKIIRMIIRIIRLQVAIRTAKPIQRSKIPPYVVVLHRGISTTYGGRESRFGFVAERSAANEAGIDKNNSVGCKDESIFGYHQSRPFLPDCTDL